MGKVDDDDFGRTMSDRLYSDFREMIMSSLNNVPDILFEGMEVGGGI